MQTYKKILTLLLASIISLFCLPSFAMDNGLVNNLQDFTKNAQSFLQKVQQVLNNQGANPQQNNLAGVISHDTLREAIHYLQQHPAIFTMLHESVIGKPSWKTKCAQYLTSLSSHVLYESKGVLNACVCACIITLVLQTVCPDFLCTLSTYLPQGIYAGASSAVLLVTWAKLYTMLKAPTSIQETMVHKAFNLLTQVAPAAQLIAPSAQQYAAHGNRAIPQEAIKAYNNLVQMLSNNQINLLENNTILLLGLFYPEELLKETEFLDSLDEQQVTYAHDFFINTIAYRYDTKFANMAAQLPDQVTNLLQPPNKLLLAAFNAHLLFLPSNRAFLQQLPQ